MYFLGSGPKPTLWPLAHTPQRGTANGPAGHILNFLSLQGQPKSFAISSGPRIGWRRQHGVATQPWTWSQKTWS